MLDTDLLTESFTVIVPKSMQKKYKKKKQKIKLHKKKERNAKIEFTLYEEMPSLKALENLRKLWWRPNVL